MLAKARTFVLIKPEGVERKLVGEIIRRFESKGLEIEQLKVVRPTRDIIETHYAEHKEKDFYDKIVEHLCDKKCVAMILSNPDQGNVVFMVRYLMGSTDPVTATPGTIRGDFGTYISRNVIHGSDSPAAADREIELWFKT
jgi:nucleoside-diphosphate kinase